MKYYTVLYSHEGYFLTFTKRDYSYFKTNEINSHGFIIDDGPNQFTFPGGSFANKEEKPFMVCLRTFREGCGKKISFQFSPLDKEQSLGNLRNMMLNRKSYEILLGRLMTQANQCHILYLEFSTKDLKQIQGHISTTNIAQANLARIAIYNEVIQEYEQIFKYFSFSPLNDTLHYPELWQIGEIEKIKLLKQNKMTTIYYNMIVYLANNILNANISYSDKLLTSIKFSLN